MRTWLCLVIALALTGCPGPGISEDAGTPTGNRDSGVVDSGTPDAGQPDAGPVDAGIDAGFHTLSISGGSQAEGQSGVSQATLTVTLTPESPLPVTVDWQTSDGTASSDPSTVGGADFASSVGTLYIPAGKTTAQIAVPVVGDRVFETDESFSVSLTNARGAELTGSTAQFTLTNDDAIPTLSAAPVSVPEGNVDAGVVQFTISLSAPTTQTVTLDYATQDGTATAGSDYTAASGTLSFPPGSSSQTVQVAILPDYFYEPDETFSLNLSNAVNATLQSASVQGVLRNDDNAPPFISVSGPSSVTEGATGTTSLATFALAIPQAYPIPVSVDVETADGTAVAGGTLNAGGQDYVPLSQTVTFAPGETSKSVSVTVNGDDTSEGQLSESFELELSNAVNGRLYQSYVTAWIDDDDGYPTLQISSPQQMEGNGPSLSTMNFQLTLDHPSATEVYLAYQTIPDSSGINPATANTATAFGGNDYLDVSGWLSFPPGTTSATVPVPISGDTLDEANETLRLLIQTWSANLNVPTSSAVGTITNDDQLPLLSVVPGYVAESSGAPMTFYLTLNQPSGRPVQVSYQTVPGGGGAATAGLDYQNTSGVATFPPGTTTIGVPVQVFNDSVSEGSETVTLQLSGPVNVFLPGAPNYNSNGTILDDDTPSQPTVTLSASSFSVAEGNTATNNTVMLTATLSAPTNNGVTVNLRATGITATALGGPNGDFNLNSTMISIPPNATSGSTIFTTIGDTLYEADETVVIDIVSATNANPVSGPIQLTISNDDVRPTLRVSSPGPFNEGNSGLTTALASVILSPDSALPVAVAFDTEDTTPTVSATPTNPSSTGGSDYVKIDGTLLFLPGETTKSVPLAIRGDGVNEASEAFQLKLSNPQQASIVLDTTQVSYSDDDAPPTVSVQGLKRLEGTSVSTSMQFRVSLSRPSSKTVTVSYATADGTATAGTDYTATNGTLTFIPGDVGPQYVNVSLTADSTVEPDETFNAVLSNPINATLGTGSAVCTLVNDD